MPRNPFDPRYRAVLFRHLEVADTGQAELDRLFRLLDEGRRAAQKGRLDALAERFAGGQTALIDALRDTGHFLEWELAFIRLGLTAGDARQSYRYLSAHYGRLAEFARRLRHHGWLPLLVLAVACLGVPALAWAERSIAAATALLLALGSLAVAAVMGGLLQGAINRWRAGRLPTCQIAWLHRLPAIGPLLAQQQNLHYFAALECGLGAGLPLAQALQLASDVLPESPRRRAFEEVHRAVATGARLSDALRRSGALAGVQIRDVTGAAQRLSGVARAQHVLTESTRLALMDGMAQASRWLPQLALAGVALVVLVNWLAMQ